MGLKLRVLSGPREGEEIPLKSGLKFGRTKGDVLLEDSKVSSLHAFLREEPHGSFILQDNGSKNGIRVGNDRLTELNLDVGIRFYIGISEFEVVGSPGPETPRDSLSGVDLGALSENLKLPEVSRVSEIFLEPPAPRVEAAPPPIADPEPETKAAPMVHPAGPEPRRWNQVLEEELLALVEKIQDQPQMVKPFERALRLTFLGGLQTETEWCLGYGPRKFGAACPELPILEPNSPDICFELHPANQGVTFLTNHPKQVLINGRSTPEVLLKQGDLISVGAARIEVNYIE